MNNKAIIEFGFRMIWRIMQISEGVNTLLDLHNSSYHTQPHPKIETDFYISQSDC